MRQQFNLKENKTNKYKKLSKETGIIHLEDLTTNGMYRYQDKFYIKLNHQFKRELYNNLLRITGTIKNLSKKTGVSFTRLWDQLNRVTMSIEVLKRISKLLIENGFYRFSLNNIEKNIIFIKSSGSKSQKIYYPKFPINLLTKEGIRFIAHLYHDGGIGETNRQPQYTNQSKEEIKQFLEDGKKIFGNFERKIKKGIGKGKDKKRYYFIHLPTVIGDIMISIGYVSGDKTKNNSEVFGFMKNLKDKDLIYEYLSKSFNDDGNIGDRKILLEQSSLIKDKERQSNVLLLDKLLLERIGIKVWGPRLVKKYNNRYGLVTKFKIEIYSKKYLRMFYENIKLIEYKQEKLRNYLIGSRKTT